MKNVGWYIVAAMALLVAFIVRSPYMAYAVYAFLLLVLVARFSSLAWLTGLHCERSVTPVQLRQGESVEVSVTVTNARGWPIPWIFVEDQYPPDFSRVGTHSRLAILMPGRSLTLKYQLTCPRRGYHRIGPVLMESGDLFGLQRRFKTATQRDYISVLPNIAYVDTLGIASHRPQGPVRMRNRIYEDPTRIQQIRDYVPGDPLRMIHWKATARTGALQVKTHEPAIVVGGTLLLDLHEDSYIPEKKEERMELAITTTTSIAYLLQMSGEQVGMVTNGRDAAEEARFEAQAQQGLSRDEVHVHDEEESLRISPLSVPTRRSPIQSQKIMENLARILPGHGLDANQLVMASFQHLPRDAALLLVTPQVTETLALTLGMMKLHGFAVTVFFIQHEAGYQEAAALLAQHNIHVFHITHERDLYTLAPEKIGQ